MIGTPERLNNVANQINDYATNVSALETMAKELNLPYNASPLYNFRDALNHYRILYEKQEIDEDFIIQENSINEHLFRGLKDISVYIVFNLIIKLKYFTNDVIVNDSISKKNKYRKLIHKIKNLQLDFRSNSESLCIRNLKPSLEKLNNLITEIKSTLASDQASHILRKRVQ